MSDNIFTVGENAVSKYWRERAEQTEAQYAALQRRLRYLNVLVVMCHVLVLIGLWLILSSPSQP